MSQDAFTANNELLQALEGRSETIVCGEGGTLFHQGEKPRAVYFIRDGEASLKLLSPAGSIIASFRAGAGSVLGLPAALSKEPYTLTAVVRRGSVLGLVRLEDFEDLLQTNPKLYTFVLSILASEVRAARTVLAGFTDEAYRSEGRPREFRLEAHKAMT